MNLLSFPNGMLHTLGYLGKWAVVPDRT